MPGRHLLDRLVAALALVALSPLLLAAAIGVKLSSRGPVLYRARRAGRGGCEFTMYKFRTMHAGVGGAAITANRDPRVFAFGAVLRTLKIDELPQLWNIVRGEMAIVGPRPEDPRLVAEHYTIEQWHTLDVLPGLTSPGSLFYYTHGEALMQGDDAERDYVERLLPVKLALDLVYVERASLAYDVALVFRTAAVILQIAAGRRHFPEPPELAEARWSRNLPPVHEPGRLPGEDGPSPPGPPPPLGR